MYNENVRTLMENALIRMKQDGVSAKILTAYRTTGFGPIIMYCEKTECIDYKETVINEAIQHSRSKYECGEIPYWKWNLVRRRGELLKHFHKTNALDLPSCPRWEFVHNRLHNEPTPEELSDPDNIFTLAWRAKQELLKFNLKRKTMKMYQYYGFDRILIRHIDSGLTHYSPQLTTEITNDARLMYEQGEINRMAYQSIRKTTEILKEFRNIGKLEWRHIQRWGTRNPNDIFSEALDAFCNEYKLTGALKGSSVLQVTYITRGFLFQLEDMGYENFSEVTLRVVSNAISLMAKRFSGGTSGLLFALRTFLSFLNKSAISTTDFSIAIPELAAPRYAVREGFHTDEIDTLLNHPNKNTPMGKRDYAIMLTAARTGLRAVDIANLKRQDIDWRTNEIRIVQHKTGVPLCLPLTAEVGNAIANYLRCGRPECDLPYIFICKDRPFRPLKNETVGFIVSKYMKQTGISNSNIPRRRFHSFRRSFGKQLLNAEIPLDMLIELLGQTHIDSAKPYLAIHEIELKGCSLSLAGIEKAGELQ